MKVTALLSIIRNIFISSVAALPISLLFFAYEGSMFYNSSWTRVVGVALAIMIVAVVGCIVVGMPIHFFLQRKNITSRLAYGIAGFIAPLAIIASVPIITMDWIELVKLNNYENAIIFGFAGASVALAWRELQNY